ncbi:MAG: redoxin domain-containing protein [Pseudomonadota bacterium]
MPMITPGQPFPELELPMTDGSRTPLIANETPMTMIDIYRGLHCPRCKDHLGEIAEKHQAFKDAGITVVALSTDPKDRAEQAVSEWGIGALRVGYALSIDDARRIGLAISQSIREGETDQFAEPGVFFIQADGTLYGSIVQTFPFARPKVDDLIEVGQVVRDRNYPPRGTLAA